MNDVEDYIPSGYNRFVTRFRWKLDWVIKSIHSTNNFTVTVPVPEPLDTMVKVLIEQVFADWKEQILKTNTEIKELCIDNYGTVPNIPILAVEIGIGVYFKEDESEKETL